MITYQLESGKYSLSYSELKEKYQEIIELSDADFLKRLPEVLHLACIVCFLKETPSYVCLADDGIIHELVHLLHIPNEPMIDLKEIRELFEAQIKLA